MTPPTDKPQAMSAERFAEIADLSVDACAGEAPYNADVWTLEQARKELVEELRRLREGLGDLVTHWRAESRSALASMAAADNPPATIRWNAWATACQCHADEAQRLIDGSGRSKSGYDPDQMK